MSIDLITKSLTIHALTAVCPAGVLWGRKMVGQCSLYFPHKGAEGARVVGGSGLLLRNTWEGQEEGRHQCQVDCKEGMLCPH